MDLTPNFGVTMISEVPSNPQLTLMFSEIHFDVNLKKIGQDASVRARPGPQTKMKKC